MSGFQPRDLAADAVISSLSHDENKKVLPFVVPSGKMPKSDRITFVENTLRSNGYCKSMKIPASDPDTDIPGSVEFGVAPAPDENVFVGVYIIRDPAGKILDGDIRIFTAAQSEKWFKKMQANC